jgi:hypothetical protein
MNEIEYDVVVFQEDGNTLSGTYTTYYPDAPRGWRPDQAIKEIMENGYTHRRDGRITYVPPRYIKRIVVIEKPTND